MLSTADDRQLEIPMQFLGKWLVRRKLKLEKSLV